MTAEVQQPNPIDLAREQIDRFLQADDLNGAKVMIALDKLENEMLGQHFDPLKMFTELGSHAATARDKMNQRGDMLQSQMFEMRASNYLRTAELLKNEQQTTPLAPNSEAVIPQDSDKQKAPRTRKTSAPTDTSTLPSTTSAKK